MFRVPEIRKGKCPYCACDIGLDNPDKKDFFDDFDSFDEILDCRKCGKVFTQDDRDKLGKPTNEVSPEYAIKYLFVAISFFLIFLVLATWVINEFHVE